ncbi:hypothetical protein JRQ81_010282 [Phrynocephalus forsythii]|uniref:Argonaute hook domain-containing protein n=1 Tax=Phrynocephalus forsythii TaxID=171643 RepID=A0A9Q0X8B3_9SAUR|nr:hypothetical protein JRQ81_010282 [Phrynocephalus forsythii]
MKGKVLGGGPPVPFAWATPCWGEPPPAAPSAVDNGTSAWGKPVDTGTSWGETLIDPTGSSSSAWGSATFGRPPPGKPGPKSMQAPDGWCGGDMPLAGAQHPSWEDDEDVEIGMWNSHSVQDSNSSLHWNPGSSKKLPPKGTMKNGNKQDDTWINPFVKQFANLGFPRESPEEMVQSNKMDIPGGLLPDKWMEMEKHNLNAGEYGRAIGKALNSRPPVPKESSMDRCPYFDKEGLLVADESPNVPFLSNPNAKFPLQTVRYLTPPLARAPG